LHRLRWRSDAALFGFTGGAKTQPQVNGCGLLRTPHINPPLPYPRAQRSPLPLPPGPTGQTWRRWSNTHAMWSLWKGWRLGSDSAARGGRGGAQGSDCREGIRYPSQALASAHIRRHVNMARIRQSRPDSGLGFQVKLLKLFPLRSEAGQRGEVSACSPRARRGATPANVDPVSDLLVTNTMEPCQQARPRRRGCHS